MLIKIKDIYEQFKKNILSLKKEKSILMLCENNNLENLEDNNSTYSGSNHHHNYDSNFSNLNTDENNSFYEYFIRIGNNQVNEFSHKYLKLFEKNRLVKEM